MLKSAGMTAENSDVFSHRNNLLHDSTSLKKNEPMHDKN